MINLVKQRQRGKRCIQDPKSDPGSLEAVNFPSVGTGVQAPDNPKSLPLGVGAGRPVKTANGCQRSAGVAQMLT